MKSANDWRLTALLVIALFVVIYFSQALLFPVFAAVVLYFLLAPLVRFLAEKKIPRGISSAVLLFSLMSTIGLGATFLVEPANKWLDSAPQQLKQFEKKVSFVTGPIEKISDTTEKVSELTGMGGEGAGMPTESLGTQIFSITSSVFSTFMTMMVFLFFLLVYGDKIIDTIAEISESKSSGTKQLFENVEAGISNYVVGATIINTVLGVVVGFALWGLGVPNPALWGTMAGLLNFIPYLGPILGSAIVLLVSIFTFDSFWQIFLPPFAYFFINGCEGQFVTPILLGKRLNLNPLFVLLSLMLWGWMWGIEGALLSVPLLAILKIVCDHLPKTQKLASLLEA